jgi:hypothetical protein
MVRLNVDQMSRYISPVNPSAFPTLSIVLLGNIKRIKTYLIKEFI